VQHRDWRGMFDLGLELVQHLTGPLCSGRVESNLLRFNNMLKMSHRPDTPITDLASRYLICCDALETTKEGIEDAIDCVNHHPRPLALYLFAVSTVFYEGFLTFSKAKGTFRKVDSTAAVRFTLRTVDSCSAFRCACPCADPLSPIGV
jgi:hypothetical protein